MLTRSAVGLPVLALVAVAQLGAQVVADTGTARFRALARLSPGKRVRVFTAGVVRSGAVAGRRGDTLILGRIGGPRVDDRAVPLVDIDSLFVRRSHAGTGAIAGGIVGGSVLGGLLSALVSGLCEDTSGCNATGAFFTGFAVGGVVGAGVGALIGSAATSWPRLYP